jgi:DNA modification methylase
MKIINKNIDDLIAAEYNPRQLTKEQYKHISDSIKRFGIVDPIIINKNKDRKNIIIGGHQRVKVAKYLKINDIPCVEVDLSLDKERELNVRLNKNTGEWDYDILADLFDMENLIEWGFTEDELVGFAAEEKEGLIDDDEIPDDVEPICKLGDVWELGKHRLVCGDSTKKENIELLLDGKMSDILFTSPPYNMGKNATLHGNKHLKESKYKNNIDDDVDYDKLIIDSTSLGISYNKYTFYNIQHLAGNKIQLVDYLYKFKNEIVDTIIWNKNNTAPAMAKNVLNSKFEYIFIFSKDNSRAINTGNFRGTINNVYDGEPQRKNEFSQVHSATFPIHLPLFIINSFTKKNDRVMDNFLGTGTTLIACEKTNRICYGMELDKHYCDVIINRWEQYTGNKAKLINNFQSK